MKTSWNWLNAWVDLEGIDPDEASDRMTMSGLEIDEVLRPGQGLELVVVARIEKIEEHPKADKLVICKVDAGEDQLRQIVCGAKNMKEGDLVPAALPGAVLPGADFEIGARKMRGVLSQGMLCGADEIGQDDGIDGLWILPAGLTLGVPVFDALDLKDTIHDISLTPNRPDCLSHMGVARELAVSYARPFRDVRKSYDWNSGHTPLASTHAKLSIEDAKGCPRYAYAVLEDLVVGPSPAWLKQRIESIGVRSINNIVDVTNYVLMDVCQPLHSFDLDKLQGPEINVRRARHGETLMGIDHQEYTLTPLDLVIADATQPIALAGVMGGASSEVDESTTRVLLESAYFDPTTVRKSSKRHGLHTESSHRFERGIDPSQIVRNLEHAIALMLLAQPKGVSARVAQGFAFKEHTAWKPKHISLPDGLTNRILGTSISREEIRGMLTSIGLTVRFAPHTLEVHAPSWRPDLERPIDLVEEVARLVGYDRIPERLPTAVMGGVHQLRDEPKHGETIVSRARRKTRHTMRELLLSRGIHEAVNYSFMSDKDLDNLGIDMCKTYMPAHHLANPMTLAQTHMRTTLVPGLLRNLLTNHAQRARDIALFEIGRVFLTDGEEDMLGIVLTGHKSQHWSAKTSWDFYDAKGLVEALSQGKNTRGACWSVPKRATPFLHPGVQAQWCVDGERLALVGQLHPKIAQQEELDVVLLVEMHLDALLDREDEHLLYKATSKYPLVLRDYALVQDQGEPYARIEEAIEELAHTQGAFGAVFESAQLFDVYEGEHLEKGKRSVALQVKYRAWDRTLSDKEVSQISEELLSWLKTQTGVTLRS